MSNPVGDFFDSVGTQFNLPEIGLSELFSGGNRTANTGRVSYSAPAAIATDVLLPGVGATLTAGGGLSYANASNQKQAGSGGSASSGSNGGANQLNTTGTGAAYYGGSGGSAYDPNTEMARAQINQGIGQNNDALGRLDRQSGIADQNIQNQYNSAYNKLLGDQSQMRRDYGTNRDNQVADYLSARENIANNGRQQLFGGRRMLGAMGAGGGSADRYALPTAVQNNVSNKNAVVQNTNARNLAALATANDDNERKYTTGFENLATSRDSSIRTSHANFEQQRADLLNNIAQLQGQLAILNGGNYQSALAASRPYTDRVNGILSNIDALSANPNVVKADAINLTRPDLAQYAYDRYTAPSMNTAAPQDSALVNPSLTALLGYGQQQDDKQQQLV